MKPPAFWYDPDAQWLPALLSPAAAATRALTRRRLRRPGRHAGVPVICCGNLSVGGTGKTTLVLDLAHRFQARGRRVHLLIRGYGGARQHALRVDPERHDAADVGDEALLLAGTAPCWVGADRAASARAAVAAGADLLILDDGLQNPTLHQDWPLLVIDGETGFGNGHALPAGPLREALADAVPRLRGVVIIGADRRRVAARLPPGLPVLWAALRMAPEAEALRGRRLLAFAGIGRPGKFFDSLERLGLHLAERRSFPDHHRYSGQDARRLLRDAGRLGATLVTTPKDATRLPPALRDHVQALGVSLDWTDPAARDALLHRMEQAPR
ncbi:tetraacyldisaccharide 4'-kinase [Rhizosaccharibacter radicis]|uniref:Tetraacyldisaccharide 4'-kinase n=1 Tax=Rhizosaccharibacter radicis TaxID=2782605 RepID=A0ABT1VSY1_9PROT|nr:tetraacyldisaccharide 4'-kinase [Acetobacteraceae bacterium KSS12]